MFRTISVIATISIGALSCFGQIASHDDMQATMAAMLATNPIILPQNPPPSVNPSNKVRIPLGSGTPITLAPNPISPITNKAVNPITTPISTNTVPNTLLPLNVGKPDLHQIQETPATLLPLDLGKPTLRPIQETPPPASNASDIAIPPIIQPIVKTTPVLAPILPPSKPKTITPDLSNNIITNKTTPTAANTDSVTFSPGPSTDSEKPETEVPPTQMLQQIKAQAKFDASLAAKATNELAAILSQLEPTGQYVERYVRIPGGNNSEPRLVRTLVPVLRIKVK